MQYFVYNFLSRIVKLFTNIATHFAYIRSQLGHGNGLREILLVFITPNFSWYDIKASSKVAPPLFLPIAPPFSCADVCRF